MHCSKCAVLIASLALVPLMSCIADEDNVATPKAAGQSGQQSAVQPHDAPAKPDPQQVALLARGREAAIRVLRAEKAINDMMWIPSEREIHVWVADDGSSQNGYAESLCLTLSEYCVSEHMEVFVRTGRKPGGSNVGYARCGSPAGPFDWDTERSVGCDPKNHPERYWSRDPDESASRR